MQISAQGPMQVVQPKQEGSAQAVKNVKEAHIQGHNCPGIQHIHPEDQIVSTLPDSKIVDTIVAFASSPDALIGHALNMARAKHPGAQQDALREFHSDIAHMTQLELDEVKDALVQRLASPKSSQWDRNFLQKMYQLTDAVAEHRSPGLKPRFPFPHQIPLPDGGCFPVPKVPQFPYQINQRIEELTVPLNKKQIAG